MQDNEHSAWYYIKGALFLIWFVASIIALFLTAKTAPWLAISVFGQYFLVFGLIALFSMIKEGKFTPIFLIFLFVGLIAVLFGIVMQYGDEASQASFKQMIPYAGTSIFFVMGILFIINYFVRSNQNKNCIEIVRATCVDMKKRKNGTSDGMSYTMYNTYCPVFGFTYNGKSYEVNNNIYTQVPDVELGEQIDLYINPQHPKCFREDANIAVRQSIAELGFGIFFILISSMVFFILLMVG